MVAVISGCLLDDALYWEARFIARFCVTTVIVYCLLFILFGHCCLFLDGFKAIIYFLMGSGWLLWSPGLLLGSGWLLLFLGGLWMPLVFPVGLCMVAVILDGRWMVAVISCFPPNGYYLVMHFACLLSFFEAL